MKPRKQKSPCVAPVAEYKGVALIEKRGDRRTVWDGIEYFTDGNIWLMRRPTDEGIGEWLALPSEATAKLYLDQLEDAERKTFIGYAELLAILLRNAKVAEVRADLISLAAHYRNGSRWNWCEQSGVFVPNQSATTTTTLR